MVNCLLWSEVADQHWCSICFEVLEADGSSSELEPEQPNRRCHRSRHQNNFTINSRIVNWS